MWCNYHVVDYGYHYNNTYNTIQISLFKSNQIKFYLKSAMYIWKKRKISKTLFTRLYSITNNNKLYIGFKYFGTSLWNRTWPQMKIYFWSTAFYSNLVHILQRHLGPCHFLICFLNSANVIEFFILFGRSFLIFAPLYRNEYSDKKYICIQMM